MTEKIRVSYTKRATRKTGENFDTAEIGGEWEFDVPDGADVDSQFGGAFVVLKTIVDKHLEVPDVPAKAENFADKSRELQERVFTPKADTSSTRTEYRTFGPGSTAADIVEGEAVMLENGRVWEVKPEETTKNGKRYRVVRIGNKETIPTGYARVKSFEPAMINKIAGLKETNHVNVFGHYESWMGRDSVEGDSSTYMWDFVPERIEKVES